MTGSAEAQYVNFEIFGHSVAVYISDDIKALMAKNHPDAPRMSDAEAATYKYNSKAETEMYFSFAPDHGTIAHECLHAVWNIFEYHGVKVDEESTAYHLGYLIRETLKCLDLAREGRRLYEESKSAGQSKLEDAGLFCRLLLC